MSADPLDARLLAAHAAGRAVLYSPATGWSTVPWAPLASEEQEERREPVRWVVGGVEA